MDVLFKSLTQVAGPALAVLAVLLVLQFLWLARTASRQRAMASRWSNLMQGVRGENLEDLLEKHLRERAGMQAELQELRYRIESLEGRMRSAKRHMGLVRYDAFEEVGGSQSFALALFDDQGDGAVLNGIVGRSDCRVYCKPLISGRSERSLSQEEQRAIREATNDAPKSIVSP